MFPTIISVYMNNIANNSSCFLKYAIFRFAVDQYAKKKQAALQYKYCDKFVKYKVSNMISIPRLAFLFGVVFVLAQGAHIKCPKKGNLNHSCMFYTVLESYSQVLGQGQLKSTNSFPTLYSKQGTQGRELFHYV